MFEVGKKVVYPTLGVGEVKAIEIKTIQDSEEEFYILRILSDNSTVMIPTKKAEVVGIRELISKSDVSRVFEILEGEFEAMPANWSRRYRDNRDRIKSGSIFEIAAVFRNLNLMNKQRELSFGEKKMMDETKELIISELVYAEDQDAPLIEDRIDQIFTVDKDPDHLSM